MHDGGGGFSGGGGHDGGGFIGGGHHGGHDGGGGFGAGGHHHKHQADSPLSDLVNPTDPVYGNRYGRQASGSGRYRSARARDRVGMWILRLTVFAFLIFFIWWVYVEVILGHRPAG
jgi:hypothetical protein